MLTELLSESHTDIGPDREVSLKYLTALAKAVPDSVNLARIVSALDPTKLRNLTEAYERVGFVGDENIEVEDYLNRLIELDEMFVADSTLGLLGPRVLSMAPTFQTMADLYRDAHEGGLKWRDLDRRVFSVAEAVLIEYGRDCEFADSFFPDGYARDEEAHVGVVDIGGESRLRMIADLSSNELLSRALEVKRHHVQPGFDDAVAALVAAQRGGGGAELYKRLGFTSREKIESVDFLELAGLGGLFDYGYQKDFWRLVGEHVHGKTEVVRDFTQIGEQENGKFYLKAFGGSRDMTRRVLKMSEEERPSPLSIMYVREALGIYDFGEVISTARRIDVPSLEMFVSDTTNRKKNLAISQDAIRDLGELEIFLERSDEVVAEFVEIRGEDAEITYHEARLMLDFEGDRRFLAAFESYEQEEMEKVMGAMDFDTYQSIGLETDYFKKKTVCRLLDEGWTGSQLSNLFDASEKVWVHDLEKWEDMGFDTLEAVNLCRASADPSVHGRYVKAVDFKEYGMPLKIVEGLKANGISPGQLATFGNAVALGQYYSREDGFDSMALIRDLREFYGATKIEATNS